MKILGGEVLNKNILMNDSLVFEKEVHSESVQENFVDLNQFDPDIIVDPTLSNRSHYFSFVRISIAEKLSIAKKQLPRDLRFLIKEGFRPLHIQQLAFERSIERVKNSSTLKDKNAIIAEASKYVAPPTVAPHPTGGAVDLTFIDSDGNELNLGTPFDAVPHECNYATYFNATNIPEDAIRNRKVLANALQSVGFVNYYTEWWHWSFGDKYWAAIEDSDYALFAPVSEQELANLI